jgi:hypothetical protein
MSKFFTEELGSRLQGGVFACWFIMVFNAEAFTSLAKTVCIILVIYFIYFGNSRFGGEYKKII